MPIVTLQQQMRELGRIRAGQVVTPDRGKARPSKLETFRLTSKERPLIDAAAAAYGGEVVAWAGGEGEQWEVVTAADALEILVPPWQALSQWFELWSAGGCQRRCDGRVEVLTDSPCKCPQDPGERRDAANANPPTACKPTTRLAVMLPRLPGLGVWRLESHGFYAAVELAGAARILELASRAGEPLPARLRLDQRVKKVPGKPSNRYAVPVIEIEDVVGELLAVAPPDEATGLLALGDGGRARVLEAPEADLPDTSSFRAPGGATDDGVTTTSAPVDAGPGPVPPAHAVHVEPSGRVTDPVADTSVGLTSTALGERLRDAKISVAYAEQTARLVWPGWKAGDPMTNADRARLWAAVQRAVAGERI